MTPIQARDTNLPKAPPTWRWVALKTVANLESGHTPSRRKPDYWNGGIRWLSLKDIRGLGGNTIYETIDHPTEQGIANSSARLLPAGTVALCRTASVGKCVILGREMATSQDFVNWTCSRELVPAYLLAAFRASQMEFDRVKQGSTHKTIYMPVVERFRLLLPPLEEQHRIAATLDKADAIRRKRQQAMLLSEQLIRSVFLDMFGDPVTNPKGWEVRPLPWILGDRGLRNGLSPSSQGTKEARVLTLSAITRGAFAATAVKKAKFVEVPKGKVVDPSDFLICRGNGNIDLVGRAHFPSTRMEGVLFPDTMIGAHIDRDKVAGSFLEAQWSTPGVRRQIRRGARTTNGTYKINQRAVEAIELLVPPRDMQEKFEELAIRIKLIRDKQREGQDSAHELFGSLVQRAFRGEL